MHNNSHQTKTIYEKLTFFPKLVRRWNSKEWAKCGLECLLLIFTYSNSKFKVTCKNEDFECQYIRTHTKEQPSKISYITFAIWPFNQRKKYSNWLAILSTLEPTTLKETIRSASKWFTFTITQKMQNLELVNLECLTYEQPITLSLIRTLFTLI